MAQAAVGESSHCALGAAAFFWPCVKPVWQEQGTDQGLWPRICRLRVKIPFSTGWDSMPGGSLRVWQVITAPKTATQRSWGRSRKAVSVLVCPHRGLGSAPTHHGRGLDGRSGKSHRTDYRGKQRASGPTELRGTLCDVHRGVLMGST